MKKKALVLAVCMAFGAPTISAAKAFPSDLLGVNLGEIQSKSFLNEPFKGIIPILFTDIETAENLNVRLAHHSIFQKMGAEKLSILDSLNFQISVKNNKPVILISSSRPIQMPFLNFILEIEGPQGSTYQDYTTLLDPKGYSNNSFPNTHAKRSKPAFTAQVTFQGDEALLLESYSSNSLVKAISGEHKHKVRSGDTLSEIAQALNAAEVSLKRMISGIYRKNPSAFINNDINRLKAGATLEIPTQRELSASSFKTAAKAALKKKQSASQKAAYSESLVVMPADAYRIKRGDNLSQITKSLGHKGLSFTKMMAAIYNANPHAFSKNKINLLKVGKILRIPSVEEVSTGKSVVQESNKQMKKFVDPNLVILGGPKSTEKTTISKDEKEFKLKGFVVEKGDTLASITKEIGHKGVSFTKMMKAIYIANPEAFEKDNVTTLKEGAIIYLPSKVDVEAMSNTKIKASSPKNKVVPAPKVIPTSNKSSLKPQNAKEVVNLEKRVRELKRELYKARANFSHLKLSLSEKEALLKEQGQELRELALEFKEYEDGDAPSATLALGKNGELLTPVDPEEAISAKKAGDSEEILVAEQDISEALLAAQKKSGYIPYNIGDKLASTVKNNLIDYSKYMSNKEMLSSVLALLFGLLLIRYRREIYNYTRISYEHPSYYPPLGDEEARNILKGKSINFHDTIVDSYSEDTGIEKVSKTEFSDEQINECEDLVNELVGDLDKKKTNRDDDVDWDEINKTCDAYIAEYKDKTNSNNASKNTKTEQEEMSFEVFEALAKGGLNKEENKLSRREDDETVIFG